VKELLLVGGYLGGMYNEKNIERLSDHMRSRNQVGEILKTSSARVTIFRAAVILGQGGGSFQMLQYLVERLPIMVCPKWVLTKSQPIAIDDVVSYLVKAIDVPDVEGRSFDIGGPDVLNYVDMMKRYDKMMNKSSYYVGPKPNVINATWFVLSGLWYFGIAFSIFLCFKKYTTWTYYCRYKNRTLPILRHTYIRFKHPAQTDSIIIYYPRFIAFYNIRTKKFRSLNKSH